jgi:micrococcal nuclease
MPTIGDLRLGSKLYYYAATVTDVYDGDTFTVDMDLGLGMGRRGQRIRLWKVNAPEVRGAEREQGLAVRDYVRALILEKTVLLRTILDKRGVDSTEKFGRLLGEVLVLSHQRIEHILMNA